ncbi:cysteine--tRNA ligase [Murdochiella massiliensis]|uniref:cysteine--tRNA ligase n=1 Tax=Murdochiella massiliensis TaxID=1673723 RepID=UPI0008361191|nr:cysteine--tRNA ligase [Murdochiella massiliensis]
MKIYNTLTRRKEEFVPLEKGKVRMYVCGPTVYDFIHIGNARPLVVFDTLHRFLRWQGFDVRYVVNFTDIDDKIINRANDEGVPFTDITAKYIAAFMDQAKQLNLLEEETIHPRATEMIEAIIAFVQGLIDKGAAYDAEDAVYFDVSKAKDYGKLSGKKIEDLVAGARIRVNEAKRDPLDFALWKKQKDSNEPAWSSPWGPGRPGWHIECSTMSKTLLGETIDIHAGGSDLEFPHHENEIAQTETLTDHPFARYWMHNEMITVSAADGAHEKMSKSKGNFFMLKDIAETYDLILVRLWLLSAHYRSPINFSREVMEATKNGYERLMNGKHNLERLLAHNVEAELTEAERKLLAAVIEEEDAFTNALADDLNTADALTAIYEIVRMANSTLNEKSAKGTVERVYRKLLELLDVLGIADHSANDALDEEVERKIAEREEARKAKDFARADAIRDELAAKGILLKDTRTGVTWTRE